MLLPLVNPCRIKTYFLAKLILQDTWREEMKQSTSLAVKQSGGISGLTMDALVHQLLATAKNAIPSSIESDMKREIKEAYSVK